MRSSPSGLEQSELLGLADDALSVALRIGIAAPSRRPVRTRCWTHRRKPVCREVVDQRTRDWS